MTFSRTRTLPQSFREILLMEVDGVYRAPDNFELDARGVAYAAIEIWKSGNEISLDAALALMEHGYDVGYLKKTVLRQKAAIRYDVYAGDETVH